MGNADSSKYQRLSLVPQSTPIKYKRSSGTSHCITPTPSTSGALLEVMGTNHVSCNTRVEQLEIEFMMALHALKMIQDCDYEYGENRSGNHVFENLTLEELQSRYILAREKYKTELWNRDFEPVLQMIRGAAVAITNAELDESAKSEVVCRLMACGYVIQKEKNVLDGVLGECMRMGAILRDVELFLGALFGASERRGSWSYDLCGTRENQDATPTQILEHDNNTVAADSFHEELPETTSESDSRNEGSIDFRAYCNHIFTSLQNLHVNSTEDIPSTFSDNSSATPTASTPLLAHLYAAISAAQLQSDSASLNIAMDCDRKKFNTTLAEVQCRNEEDLSLAAGLLVEAVQVQSEVERVHAATKADLGVSVKIREEIACRRGPD